MEIKSGTLRPVPQHHSNKFKMMDSETLIFCPTFSETKMGDDLEKKSADTTSSEHFKSTVHNKLADGPP